VTNFDLVLRLFLQLTVILAACRVVGIIGRKFGQTQVVMEMVAGVLLGPSLFGLLLPGVQQWLFPKTMELVVGNATTTIAHPSMSILYALAQIGLVLYMFLVGLEFDAGLIRGRVRSASSISAAGIIVPFILGGVAALYLYHDTTLFKEGITKWLAVLYVGASMSITAFPMLARILYERKITKTRLGTVTLAAGSLDDAIAWCLLALVLAADKSSPRIALFAIGGGILYAVAMIVIGRPAFRIFARGYDESRGLSVGRYTSVLMVLMLGAWFTDAIGIYAVFGAFICGIAMPRGAIAEAVKEKTELVTTSLFLPIFFVYSGLNTRIGLVNSLWLWGLTALVMVLAVAGKGVACALAARAHGEPWRDALTIGTLMNARGLMELIILNIGLEQGIITPTFFTIMVLMAIITTLMASPLFHLFYRYPEDVTPEVVVGAPAV
jgi:Kef-type K+ transport system membrane component KefB